jgi:ADP-ribose pyrophosphatase YjhB (NUDIX family)
VTQRAAMHTGATGEVHVRLGVGVIIEDARGWILLEKRSDNGMWGPPGGGIEPGESVAQAAMREVREETGLTVEVAGLLGVYSEPVDRIVTYADNGDVRHLVDVVVQGVIRSGTLARSAESQALAFFPPTRLPSEVTPPARQPLEDFIAHRTGVLR